MSLAPSTLRRLMKEVATFRTSPPEGLRIVTNEEDMLDIVGIIAGPEGTPYEGGYFRVRFQFTEEFPAVPPKCTMLTKIFHPNVSKSGEICVNTLKKDWKREFGITHILVTIRCLLIYPNAESALDESSGKLLLENYDEYFKHAKVITSVHATPRNRPPEFNIPSAPQPSSTSTAQLPSSSKPSATSSSLPSAPVPGPSRAPAEPSVSAKPLSKSGSVVPLTMLESSGAEPLQTSSSAHSAVSQSTLSTSGSTSISSSPSSLSKTKENDPTAGSTSGNVGVGSTAVSNGPLQPASSSTNASSGAVGDVPSPTAAAMKRTAAVGGVAKRKKGLKRL